MESDQKKIFKLFNLETLPFIFLMILLVLVPVLFIPSVPFQFAKVFMVVAGTILGLVSVIVLLIKRGSISFPKSPIFLGLVLLNIVYLLTSIFGSSFGHSFFGLNFEIGTFISILVVSVLAYLVSVSFQSAGRVAAAIGIFFLVAGVLALYYITRLFFGADFLSFGVFTNVISNTIGKWNEVGVFFALSGLLSLVTLETIRLKKTYQFILYVILVLSLFMMIAVNFIVVWYVFAAMAVLFFIYQTAFAGSFSRMSVVNSDSENTNAQETRLQPGRRKIAYRALIVSLVAIFFVLPAIPVLPMGRTISQTVSAKFGVDNLEVRPSWSATYQIFKDQITINPVLGAGPNRFSTAWQLYRPDINFTNFWNVNFRNAIGLVPTSLVETGLLGLFAWLIFFAAILYAGFRAIFTRTASEFGRYFMTSTFVATLFLWIMNVVYMPGEVIWFLTFFFTGLFVASAVSAGAFRSSTFSFSRFPSASFAVIGVAVLLILVSLGFGYMAFARGTALVSFQKGIVAAQTGQNFENVEGHLTRAVKITQNDSYYRTISELNIIKIENLFNRILGGAQATDADRTEFETYLGRAIEAARLAEKNDPANFENHFAVGRVYETIVPLAIPGAYEEAKKAYESAINLSPRNPALYLAMARLETAKGNLNEAETALQKAIELKPNYIDAIFLETQISVSKGDLKKAITAAEQLAVISPNDPLSYFRLGLLKYDARDFRGAAQALEASISMVPVYANARYFLGLSYVRLGRVNDAITQFVEVKATNPENTEIDLILANLRAGKDPFATAAPEDTKPETRPTPPVEE